VRRETKDGVMPWGEKANGDMVVDASQGDDCDVSEMSTSGAVM